MESKKREKYITEWIGRPLKPPSCNKEEEDEDEEESSGAPLSSTENGSPGDKDDEGCEDHREDNGIYKNEGTVLHDVKDNEEEASFGHEGESSSSDLSEISDNED